MRNKALVEIRRKESQVRAEIEAQLGIKRAEIRDRLSSLNEQMDKFREMAEDKMRISIEEQIQGEIGDAEERLKSREEEFGELKGDEGRLEKRQAWLGAIAGRGAPSSVSDLILLGIAE